jgi:hypothetical protein
MMRTRLLRHLPAVAALALTSLAAAACSSAPVQALPIETPSPAPSTTTPDPPPTSPPTSKPDPIETSHGPPSCRGAVEYRIDASDTGPAWQRLCITVGGALRVEHLGPEGFSHSPLDKADCEYEAAVRTCRLIETGTVRFTIDNGRQIRKLTVVIARASSPPKPSPACMDARTTFPIDANEGGPPWGAAVCMKLGAEVRVENLGPEGLTVTPSNAVSCRYEAAIHQCRLVKAATVKFTTAGNGGVRTLTVVAIR